MCSKLISLEEKMFVLKNYATELDLILVNVKLTLNSAPFFLMERWLDEQRTTSTIARGIKL